MSVRAVHVTVRGRVQGVFFRASTRDHATSRGVDGWVRNRPDGTVEAWLEGEPDDVDVLLDWMRAGGPPGAVVDEVIVDERSPSRPAGFQVTR